MAWGEHLGPLWLEQKINLGMRGASRVRKVMPRKAQNYVFMSEILFNDDISPNTNPNRSS